MVVARQAVDLAKEIWLLKMELYLPPSLGRLWKYCRLAGMTCDMHESSWVPWKLFPKG